MSDLHPAALFLLVLGAFVLAAWGFFGVMSRRAHYRLLRHMRRSPESVRAIARRAALPSSTVLDNLHELEHEGLVGSRIDQVRSHRVYWLTSRGAHR